VPVTARQLVTNLCRNQYRWDLRETQRLFWHFRQAAESLGRFDDRLLLIITGEAADQS
jgi:hypothetical protein